MSTTASEDESVSRAGTSRSRRFGVFFESRNANTGPGAQNNYHQTGTGNTQYNAQTQTFYNATAPSTEDEKIRACQNALLDIRPEDHRASLISAKGRRTDGTCEWIKDGAEYQSLLRGETRLLWIQGGPGKGKTMLSIFLTQLLERTHNVIYFFCQADDERHRSATHILRSLLWQLTAQQPAIAEYLTQYLYPPSERQAVLDSRETLWSIFAKIAGDLRLLSTVCLVDGLDECDDSSQRWLALKFVDFCEQLEVRSNANSMRTIIVSRPGISALRPSSHLLLDIDYNEQISRDIKSLIAAKVEELSDQLGGTSDEISVNFKSWMRTALLERAESSFLWVGFAVTELLEKKTWTQMEATIQTLPAGLPALYSRMLRQIDPRYRAVSSRMLGWIAVAVRPLTVDELGAIIGCKACIHSEAVSAKQSVLDLLTMCAPFVQVAGEIVSLVHQSAREYLSLHQEHDTTAFGEFRIETSKVHLEMAILCLASVENYCNTHVSTRRPFLLNPGALRQLFRPQDALVDYAITHWPEHAQRSGEGFKQLVANLPLFFARRSPIRDCWWTHYVTSSNVVLQRRFRTPRGLDGMRDVDAIHMACYLGLTSWVDMLLKSKMNVLFRHRADLKGGRTGYRPLSCAVIGGLTSVVKLLLRNRANFEARNHNGTTALFQSVHWGRLEITQLLLEYGASVDVDNHGEHSILHEAAIRGSAEMIMHLLKYTSNVDCRDSKGRTPLHHACSRIWPEYEISAVVVQNLLDKGADVNSRTAGSTTPLHHAACSKNMATVQLLLSRGATVNSRDESGDTPLLFALKHNHAFSEAIVRTLLQAGAETDDTSIDGTRSLEMAWEESNFDVAQVLVEHGADMNISLPKYQPTLLHWAVYFGKERLVRELLDHGAYHMLSVPDDHGRTPLDLATSVRGPRRNSWGHMILSDEDRRIGEDKGERERIIRLLLDHGAEIDIEGLRRETHLGPAPETNNKSLVSLLIEQRARCPVEVDDLDAVVALQAAIRRAIYQPYAQPFLST
jgi:ankyrin repeat protein